MLYLSCFGWSYTFIYNNYVIVFSSVNFSELNADFVLAVSNVKSFNLNDGDKRGIVRSKGAT